MATDSVPKPVSPPRVATLPPPVSVETVRARESTARTYISSDGLTAYLVGTLAGDSFFDFDAAMRNAPKVRRLYLASTGGLMMEGRAIAALVRKRRLDTYVEHICASACTLIFVAGRDRVLGRDARLGFHQASVVDPNGLPTRTIEATGRNRSMTSVMGVNGNDLLLMTYAHAGIDKAFASKVVDTKHSDVWMPSAAELEAARVITRLARVPELPPPPGSRSQAEVDAQFARQPLWIRTASQYADIQKEARADAWRKANSGFHLDVALSGARSGLVKALQARVATAPDPALERLLAFYGRTALVQRDKDFPLCKRQSELYDLPLDPARASYEREEDQILADLAQQPASASALTNDQAIDLFGKEIIPIMAANYQRGSSNDSCKVAYLMYAAMQALPAERRLRAFRALLAVSALDSKQN